VNCLEFKESAAAYAIGALDPPEREEFEQHLAEPREHDGCEVALQRATNAASLLAASLPPERPGPNVWTRIERAITAEATARAAQAPRPAEARRRARAWWREAAGWSLAAAAAAVAFVTSVEWRHSQQRFAEATRDLRRYEDTDLQKQACLNELANARMALRQKAQAISLIEDPTTRLVQLAAQGNVPYRASAIVNPEKGRAMLLSSALPPQPGKDYQLWVIRGDEKVSAGVLHSTEGGATIATIEPEVLGKGAPDAFAVTIEPEGGRPQPTGPIVLVGALPRT
jgi:anti-sigma-K factor RskA